MRPAIDSLDRARRSLWRALDCGRLGCERNNFLIQARDALDAAGEQGLADRIGAAVARVGGDGRDLDRALAEIDELLTSAAEALDAASEQGLADRTGAAHGWGLR